MKEHNREHLMDEEAVGPRDDLRRPKQLAFLSGGGELGELIRGFDWSATPLGTPEFWPQNLRMALRIMLDFATANVDRLGRGTNLLL